MRGQYLVESEEHSELSVEWCISNSKKDSVTGYWKLINLYWIYLLCSLSLDEHFKYVLVFRRVNSLCI